MASIPPAPRPSASPPPPPSHAEKRRPWYLVAALIMALAMGLSSATTGCATITYYNGTRPSASQHSMVQDRLHDRGKAEAADAPRDHAALEAALDRVYDAQDAARRARFPIAVAELVLGWAIFFVAGRAMGGRLAARNFLLQLIAVRAALGIAAPLATPEVRRAEIDLVAAQTAEQLRASSWAEAYGKLSPQRSREVAEATFVMGAAISVALSGMILLALTRRRARAFFDAGPDIAAGR